MRLPDRYLHLLGCSRVLWCVALQFFKSTNLTIAPFTIDNGHIAQTRLILLDAALIFFMALALYSYIRFRKVRYLCVFDGYGRAIGLIFTQRVLY